MTDRSDRIVDVGGTSVRLTSLDRVLFPSVGFTKRDLIEYYAHTGDALLPHVVGRPITLHRFPEGVDGPSFFQTRAPSHPSWIRVQRMQYVPQRQRRRRRRARRPRRR